MHRPNCASALLLQCERQKVHRGPTSGGDAGLPAPTAPADAAADERHCLCRKLLAADVDDPTLMWCRACGEGFHSACVGVGAGQRARMQRTKWVCPVCHCAEVSE